MSLENRIMEDIKTAMKAKDRESLDALRAVKSAILLAKTDQKGKELTEEEEIAILQKQVKMRKEAAEQFEAQGRDEMAANEKNQAKVIERYLPQQMSEEELQAEIKKIIAETGAASMKDMGKVMGIASQKFAGPADGKTISKHEKSILSK